MILQVVLTAAHAMTSQPAIVKPNLETAIVLPARIKPKPAVHVARFTPYQRRMLILNIALGTADGIQTVHAVKSGNIELNPLARPFAHNYPAMLAFQWAHAFGSLWLSQRMRTSRHGWMRRLYWIPQLCVAGGNAQGIAYSVRSGAFGR